MDKREIKFRAWDKKYNCFSEEPYFRLMLCKNGLIYNSEIDEYYEPDERYVLHFFTGLKDKNDKDIYDGDIVKRRVVNFGEPEGYEYITCHIRWERWCFSLWIQDKFFSCLDVSTAKEYEVMGNIYEPPVII